MTLWELEELSTTGEIPEEWLEKLKKRDYIEDMCKKASEEWERINENSNKKS